MGTGSYRWMLYVTAYTAGLGLPLLVFPDAVLPVLDFRPTHEPWVRLTGTLLLALSFITFTIYRKRIAAMLVPTVIVRLGIVLVLLALGLSGQPPFLFVMAAIVLIGVIGTVSSLRRQ